MVEGAALEMLCGETHPGFESLTLRQKIRQVSTCRIFLSKPTGLVYHHASACISSTRHSRVVYHHTEGVHSVGLMIYNLFEVDDMQFLAELMIYNASHWF